MNNVCETLKQWTNVWSWKQTVSFSVCTLTGRAAQLTSRTAIKKHKTVALTLYIFTLYFM